MLSQRWQWAKLRRARTLAAALSALSWFSLSVHAAGQAPGPLVVVLSISPETPFVRRLAAELALFGYRVEVAPRAAADADLAGTLARSGGAALISVDPSAQTAEIIVGNRGSTGPTRERERLDPRRQADTNAAVLAERFRARLTELGIAPGPAAAERPPAIVPEVLPPSPGREEPEQRLWLRAGLGGTSGGLGLLPDVALE